MNRLRLTPIFVFLACIGSIFLLPITGCEALSNWNTVHHSEKRDKIFSFRRDAYIKPFLEIGLDTQGYIPIHKIYNVPPSLATAQGEVIASSTVEPAPMVDLRFVKGGFENRITDHLRLDVYADVAFLWGYILNGGIESNTGSAPPNDVHAKSGGTSPGYTAGYAPAIIPGVNAELLYFFGEKDNYHIMLGGRYREFNLRILQGGWYWQEGAGMLDDGKSFEMDTRATIADIYEKSVYIGIGISNTESSDKKNENGIIHIVTLKLGLIFNDIDVDNKWKDTINLSYDFPTVFAGLDVGVRF